MRILDNHTIANLLSLHQIIDAVEVAMVAYENKTATVPQRMHLDHGKNTLLCMPSMGEKYFSTKLVSVFPQNGKRKLPVTNGALLLNDGETGMPLALINASKLTALRTGALGAIGIKYLTPATETSIGLIGCGIQGIHQAVFACAVRKISTIHYLHRSDEDAVRLTAFVHDHFPEVSLVPGKSAEELLDKTTILVAATTSVEPVLPNDTTLLAGKHFISMGSYKPTMQELPDAVYQLADKLFIDSEFARHEVGDCINPVSRNLLKESDIFTIGKLLTREQTVDVSETTVYKSAGMALYDLFVAQAMYERAQQLNAGVVVKF